MRPASLPLLLAALLLLSPPAPARAQLTYDGNSYGRCSDGIFSCLSAASGAHCCCAFGRCYCYATKCCGSCSSGKYCSGSSCLSCPAGSYCPSGAVAPTACGCPAQCAAGATANVAVCAPSASPSATRTPPLTARARHTALCGQAGALTLQAGGALTVDTNPASLEYPANVNCALTVSLPGRLLRVSFTLFETEGGYDYLAVHDGSSVAAPQLGRFAGASLPAALVSSGSALTLQFTSDASVQGAGVTAVVADAGAAPSATPTPSGAGTPSPTPSSTVSASQTRQSARARHTDLCGLAGALTLQAGGALTVDTNPASLEYPASADCALTVSLPGRLLRVSFALFETESGYDFFTAHDGSSVAAPQLGSYSGASLPAALVSSGSALTLHFTSDYTVEGAGVTAVVADAGPAPSSSGTATPSPSPTGTPTRTPVAACAGGQYFDAAARACAACAAGRFQLPGLKSSACQPCATGYAAPAPGAQFCAACPAGRTSSADGAACQDCAPGTAAAAPGSACSSCPPGTFQPSAQSFACFQCASGNYSAGGAPFCSRCSAGSYQPAAGAAACLQCAAGSFAAAPGAAACAPCSAGSSSAGGAASCAPCSPGYFAASPGAAACAPCAAGQYQDSAGQAACRTCSAGYGAEGSGARACTPCAAGYTSTFGACFSCDPGSYAPAPGSAACSECAAGRHAPLPGSAQCAPCPADTLSAPGSAQCAACPPGTGSAAGSAQCASASASATPSQSPSPSPTRSASESPTGTPTPSGSGTGSGTGTASPTGTRTPSASRTPSPSTSLSPSPTSTATASASASLTLGASASQSSTRSASPSRTATPSAPPTPSPTPSGSDTGTPTPSGSGTGTGTPSRSASATATPSQSATPPPTPPPSPSPAPLVCGVGTFLAAGAAAAAAGPVCTPCPPGYRALPGVTGASALGQACAVCRAGSASAGAGSTSVCAPCPIGRFADGDGRASCEACPAGRYGGGAACSSCTGNTFSLPGAGACTPCGNGTLSSADATACVGCGPGRYFAAASASGGGAPSCAVCPAGRYGLPGGGACEPCPLGTFLSTAGLVGAASCTGCGLGYFGTAPGGENQALACDECRRRGARLYGGGATLADCQTCSPAAVPGAAMVRNFLGQQCRACPPGRWCDGALEDAQCYGASGHCLGAAGCAAGYSGRQCGECAAGYLETSRLSPAAADENATGEVIACQPCPDTSRPAIIGIFTAVAVGACAWWAFKCAQAEVPGQCKPFYANNCCRRVEHLTSEHSAFVNIFLRRLQGVQLLFAASYLPYPPSFNNWVNVYIGSLGFNSCLDSGLSFQAGWKLRVALPFLALLLLILDVERLYKVPISTPYTRTEGGGGPGGGGQDPPLLWKQILVRCLTRNPQNTREGFGHFFYSTQYLSITCGVFLTFALKAARCTGSVSFYDQSLSCKDPIVGFSGVFAAVYLVFWLHFYCVPPGMCTRTAFNRSDWNLLRLRGPSTTIDFPEGYIDEQGRSVANQSIQVSKEDNDRHFPVYTCGAYLDTLLQQLPSGLGSIALMAPNNSKEISVFLLVLTLAEFVWFFGRWLCVEHERAWKVKDLPEKRTEQDTAPFETRGEQLVNAVALVAALATHIVGVRCANEGGVGAGDSSVACEYSGSARDGAFLLVLYGVFSLCWLAKFLHLLCFNHGKLQTCHGVNIKSTNPDAVPTQDVNMGILYPGVFIRKLRAP